MKHSKLYDTNSITTNNGAKTGIFGKKSESVKTMFKPIILIAKNDSIDKLTVTTIWLVTVKLKGIIPSKLQKKMNENIEKRNGKYRLPFFLTFSVSTLK